MKKILLRISLFFLVSLIVLGVIGYVVGLWWMGKYLESDPEFGEIQLQVKKANITWGLSLKLEEVSFYTPSANIFADHIYIDIDLFSTYGIQPSASAHLGHVQTVFKKSSEPKDSTAFPDSLPFPDFHIPIPVKITVESLHLKDSLPLVTVYSIGIENSGSRVVVVNFDSLNTVRAEASPGLNVIFDWSDEKNVNLIAQSFWKGDSVSLHAVHSKANLLQGIDSLRIHLNSSRPYLIPASTVGPLDSAHFMPDFTNLQLDLTVSLDTLIATHLNLNTKVVNFSDSLPARLTSQVLSINFHFEGEEGGFKLNSRGEEAEDIHVNGKLKVNGGISLDSLENLMNRFHANIRGHLRGIPVKVGDKWKTASLDIHQLTWSEKAIHANLQTGDGSIVTAELQKVIDGFSGHFSAEVQKEERWIDPFLDSNVAFEGVGLKGNIQGTNLDVISRIGKFKAYGAMGDSLMAWHKIRQGRYILDSAKLFHEGSAWNLAGFVDYKQNLNMSFTMSHPKYGSALFAIPKPNVMKAEVKDLHIWKVPYSLLDTVQAYQPVLSGLFFWDQKKKEGNVDVKVSSIFGEKNVRLAVEGQWTPDTLDIKNLNLQVDNSSFRAKAQTVLNGEQFYDFAEWAPEQFIQGEIKSEQFNLGEVMSLFMKESPIQKAVLHGNLSYSDSLGFQGLYSMNNIEVDAIANKLSVKKFNLNGSGESLLIEIVTESKESPFFNDTLSLRISGILEDKQQVDLRLAVGDSLEFKFDGVLNPSQNIKGELRLRGQIDLPGKSGQLRRLKWNGRVDIPFKNTFDSMLLVTDFFKGEYLVPEFQLQSFSAHPRIQAGILKIPDLEIRSSGSKPLEGSIAYPLNGKAAAPFRIQGPYLAFNYAGNTFKLSEIFIHGSMDSVQTVLEAQLQKMEVAYSDFPLKAEGVLMNTQLSVNIPHTNKQGVDSKQEKEKLTSVTVSATLNSSLLRYRLKSLKALRELFSKKDDSHRARTPSTGPQPFNLKASIKTSSVNNHIDTDIIRLNYVADIKIEGTYPYTLWNGRINGIEGELGLENQSYQIETMETKWLNEELNQGELNLISTKQLAVDCQSETKDSCHITTILQGELQDLKFNYTSDCGGAEDAGVNIAALMLSARRGCYDPALAGGGDGYAAGAASLLQPAISGKLSKWVGDWTGNWISSVNVTGLESLISTDSSGASSDNSKTSVEPVSIEIITKEYRRIRLKVKGGLLLNEQEMEQPYALRAALQYRPSLHFLSKNSDWRRRLRNNVALEGTLEVDPRDQTPTGETQIQKKVELSYEYGFWNLFGWKMK